MMRFFAWLALVLVVAGCAQKTSLPRAVEKQLGASSLDELAFTNLCAQALSHVDASATVTIAGPLRVSVKTRGIEVLVSFEDQWHRQPEDRAVAVWEHVRHLDQIVVSALGDGGAPNLPPRGEVAADGRFDSVSPQGRYRGSAENIVPLVRGEVDAAVQGIKNGTYPQIGEHLAGDVWVVYAFNEPEMFLPVTSMDLQRLNIAPADLRGLSLRNLRAAIPPVGRKEKRSWVMLTLPNSGGNFEASLMLLDDLWAEEEQHVSGDLVAIVPARDVLAFTGSKNPELSGFARQSGETFSQMPHHVSKQAFVRKNGKWEVFPLGP